MTAATSRLSELRRAASLAEAVVSANRRLIMFNVHDIDTLIDVLEQQGDRYALEVVKATRDHRKRLLAIYERFGGDDDAKA